ncbi:MAG: hypothetical protein K9G70_11130 [Prolixibacteraceae bacterium]|nr:hypothetical protein [Prolixibacteraceae bacterium]
MKRILFVIMISCVAFSLKAQEVAPMFVKGDKIINVGIGLGYYTSVSASLDYGIADEIADLGSIGVGPYAAFGFRYSYSAVMAGVRGTFHYPFVENFDTYVGLGLGLSYNMYNSSHWNYSYDPFIDPEGGFFIGARYKMSETLTVFGELGYGISYLNVGLALKF